jgi:gas vesicle protein
MAERTNDSTGSLDPHLIRTIGDYCMGKRYNDDESSGSGTGSWFAGLIIGAVGGAFLALLTAPKPGSEVRGVIKQTANDLPEKVGELVDESLDLYAYGLNRAQMIIEELTNRSKEAVRAGRLAAAKRKEELEADGSSILPFQHR